MPVTKRLRIDNEIERIREIIHSHPAFYLNVAREEDSSFSIHTYGVHTGYTPFEFRLDSDHGSKDYSSIEDILNVLDEPWYWEYMYNGVSQLPVPERKKEKKNIPLPIAPGGWGPFVKKDGEVILKLTMSEVMDIVSGLRMAKQPSEPELSAKIKAMAGL